ncbi:MAG: hypothetical protein KGP14_03180 [Betaproteobacteria bacterium]|nr:hypothetical protein [Betaproteobacteria bacterium]
MKYLLLFGLLGAIWWVWSKRNAAEEGRSTPRKAKGPEKMVRCAQCGVYLPESDSIADGEQAYCCEAHRSAGPVTDR